MWRQQDEDTPKPPKNNRDGAYDEEGNPVLHSPGDYNVAVPGHRDIEYRTHLSIRSIPSTPRLEDLEAMEKSRAEGKLSVKAFATVETVIPIILRLGDPQAEIELANPILEMGTGESISPTLYVDMIRAGNRSVYGEMEVIHIAPDGQEQQLYYARGLAVYFPTAMRHKRIQLKTATPEILRSGRLLVRYDETEDMRGDESAQLTIPLGAGGLAAQ